MHLSLSFPAFVLALASLTPFTSAQVYTVSLVAYDRTFFQGRSVTYNRGGNFRLGFNANSFKFRQSADQNCCVTLCLDTGKVGYWCQSSVSPSSGPFNKVSIDCGRGSRTCNF
ncbi:hypothetical protein H2199_007246 [Coniosporium tulheliwenetii]|uniref:Uncharacterized protein n=1 Tax=Coniosporium tulheliwenetii TaxID=3383036 RepID=A0ACC2YQS6_9PEZI|nr:hypothetical protein H2199_007246 [Cladosporium sp. JES 115]